MLSHSLRDVSPVLGLGGYHEQAVMGGIAGHKVFLIRMATVSKAETVAA